MNAQHSLRKAIILLATIAVMIMSTTAVQASWLSPAFYGDELERCAAQLRTELNLNDVALVRHDVTEIDKVGVWYVFDIRTALVDAADTVISEVETRCKAHRWNERTVVDLSE